MWIRQFDNIIQDVNLPCLPCQQSISPDIWQDMPDDGFDAGQVIAADETKNLTKSFFVIAIRIIPAHCVYPEKEKFELFWQI